MSKGFSAFSAAAVPRQLVLPVQLKANTLWMLLVLSLLSGFTFADNKSSAVSLRVGMDLWPGYYPLVIAKQQQLFNPKLVNVSYRIPENTNQMLQDFIRGDLNIVCVALGDLMPIIGQIPDSKIIMVADLSAGGDGLLAMSALDELSPPIRIGTNLGGFGEVFIEQFIQDYNISRDQITLVDLDASEALQRLQQGDVEIAHSWEPYLSRAERQGARLLYTSRQTPGLIPDVVIARGDLIQQQPQALQHFVQGWLRASEWWHLFPHRGNQILLQTLPIEKPVSSKGVKLMGLRENIEAMGDGRSPRYLGKAVKRYVDYFYPQGINNDTTAKDFYTAQFLPRVIGSKP